MEILKCGIDQLDSIAEFYDMVTEYLEENINYPKWVRGEYPGRESVKKAIEEGVQYACVDSGRTVGAFILNDNPQGDYSVGEWMLDAADGEYLVIHTLAVAPDSYGRGIGVFMVNYCLDKASKDGCKAVRLDVVPDNVPARRLYEKTGFSFAGEKDLGRNIEEIPMFALYEFNFS